MVSKVPTTLKIVAHAIGSRLTTPWRREKPQMPERILLAHHLLLGDTILLTPLLAKLREHFPSASIFLTTPKAMVPLYSAKPYGIEVWPFSPRDTKSFASMLPQAGFDLAIIPGDDRHSWMAAALRARWIVAHAGERRRHKSWMVDEFVDYPSTPKAMGDIFAELIPGLPPKTFRTVDWPAPDYLPFEFPPAPYAVLHVGASSTLKLWEPVKWRFLAHWFRERGISVVWSGGINETAIVAEIDPAGQFRNYAGQLDLAQLWHLLANAAMLVCPDTGVSHLARLTGTPTVTLFGPGSASLFGTGAFWRDSPRAEVTIDDFSCRDQHVQFTREISWIRRCGRSPSECPAARCMQAIDTVAVIKAIESLLESRDHGAHGQRLVDGKIS